MKRKITPLEQKLLDKNWKLCLKEYKGKYSQFTRCYIFEKEISLQEIKMKGFVELNKYRNEVINYYVSYSEPHINKQNAKDINLAIEIIESELFENQESTNEIVEIVEAIESEN